VALALPALGRAYDWPLKPFDAQHPIRGSFNDPRLHINKLGVESASFHFGIDISAATGTPVYAVAAGTVFRYADAVAVRARDGHEFSYWHIQAAVTEHQYVDEYDLLGWVRPGWGHVHFAESTRTDYLNPLRPGALQPYVDTTVPTVAAILQLPGEGLVANVYDTPPLAPPAPWGGSLLTPALVRWRIGDGAWRTAADFGDGLLPPSSFDQVYARGTRQNKEGRPGRYLIWLTHNLELPPGTYRIEVAASDLAGNVGTRVVDVRIQSLRRTNRSSAYTRGSRAASGVASPRRSTSHLAP
jgi:hypothetical protein